MLQSIMIIFWDGLLEPPKSLLSWKKIWKDARKCFYQGSRLVLFVYEELVSVLMHTYVSDNLTGLHTQFTGSNEQDKSKGNFVCFVSKSFSAWLDMLSNSDDNWLKMYSLYLRMSRDFFLFLSAYRNGDSIAIEQGYKTFSPMWRAL